MSESKFTPPEALRDREHPRISLDRLSHEPLTPADSVLARLPHNQQVNNMFTFLAAIN